VRAIVGGQRDRDVVAVLYAPWCPFCQAMEPAFSQLASELAGSHVTVAKYQADIDRDFANENLGLKTFPTIIYLPKVCYTTHTLCASRGHHEACLTSVQLLLLLLLVVVVGSGGGGNQSCALRNHVCATASQNGPGYVKYPSERRDVDTLKMWVKSVAGSA
jgi:thiol-disulfide isomerase/thioredoxin